MKIIKLIFVVILLFSVSPILAEEIIENVNQDVILQVKKQRNFQIGYESLFGEGSSFFAAYFLKSGWGRDKSK